MKLARIVLFIVITILNAGIFTIALKYIQIDFKEPYLLGKEALFEGFVFPISLIVHALSAPIALLIISVLVLLRIEKHIKTHRFLGKTALLLVVTLVVPSGLGLSYFAMGGLWGKFLFFILSVYTGYVALQGYSSIRNKRITEHRFWMYELLILLSSALILRLLMALFTLALYWKGDSMYLTAAFLSWIPGILIVKWVRMSN